MYQRDPLVAFLQVENCYFKIHKYFLQRDSQVFRDLFSCPCPPGSAEPEGKTKETAVVLPGVTKYEMSCLLKFLYHGYVYAYLPSSTHLQLHS